MTPYMHLLEMRVQDERVRRDRFRRAWKAYRGEWRIGDPDLSKPLKVDMGSADDNVIVAKARVIVDVSVGLLFGKGVEFQLDATRQTPEEDWLKACWEANRKASFLMKMATNGSVCGHAFLRIVPDHFMTRPYPRLINLDPAMLTVLWQDDDIEQAYEYHVAWNAHNVERGRMEVRRQRIVRFNDVQWLIIDEVSEPNAFVPEWREISRQTWPYAWPPIVDCQNLPAPNEYWGEPDLTDDLIDLNNSRNFVLSNWSRIIKFHASPLTIGKGLNNQEVTVGPNRLVKIPINTDIITEWPQGDLAGTSDFDRRVDEALHELSGTPAIATGKLESIGNLSGTALQVLWKPALDKTDRKRMTYGDMLIELNRRLLELGGFGDDKRVTLGWPELLPRNALEERQTLQADKDLGVASKETIAGKLGYDYEVERARIEQEAEAGREFGQELLAGFERNGLTTRPDNNDNDEDTQVTPNAPVIRA